MNKLFSLFFITQVCTCMVFGQQDNNYRDLLILYADGDYKKCIKKAKKYIEADNSSNDEYPYLISSAAYFEMSKDHLYDSEFPNAYQNALDFAGYAYNKSKDSNSYSRLKNSFIPDLIMSAIKDVQFAMYNMDSIQLSEVVSRMNRLIVFNPYEPGFVLIKSAYQNHSNDSTSAEQNLNKGLKLMQGIFSIDSMSEVGVLALKIGLIISSEYYTRIRQNDKAKNILNHGVLLFAKDEEFMYYIDQL